MELVRNTFVVGFNYKTCGVDERKQLSHINKSFYQTLWNRYAEGGLSTLIFLSTCNRLEFYGHGDEQVRDQLVQDLEQASVQMQISPFRLTGHGALKHIFRVASGLDSQLVGDLEILGQFKKAVKQAKKLEALDGFMERLTNMAVKAAKDIRTDTSITNGITSHSYAAVRILSDMNLSKKARILVIGTGKFGKSIGRNISSYFPKNELALINRTLHKSEALAKELGCSCHPWNELKEQVNEYDVLISAVGKADFQVTTEWFHASDSKIIIDLSMPPVFAERLKETPNYKLFQLDEASKIINDSMDERKSSIPEAVTIQNTYLEDFLDWAKVYTNSQSIKAYKKQLTRQSNVCPHFQRLPGTQKKKKVNEQISRFVHFIKQHEPGREEDSNLLQAYLDKTLAYVNLCSNNQHKTGSCRECLQY